MPGVESESSKKKRKTQVGSNSFGKKAQPFRGQTLEDWAFAFVGAQHALVLQCNSGNNGLPL